MITKDEPLINENESIKYEIEAMEFHPNHQCICRYCLPRRYCVVLMSSWGCIIVSAMRVNLSVAIEPISCQFNWDSFTEGLIVASFWGGYLLGSIPGSWLAHKFGGKTVFGISVLMVSILSLILPVCVSGKFGNDHNLTCYCKNESGWCFDKGNFTNDDSICNVIITSEQPCNVKSFIWILVSLRFLMGTFESVIAPALYALLNQWTTDSERTRMVGITFAGWSLGVVLGLPISSFIIASDNSFYGGWPYVFYLFSTIGILWWLIWIIIIADSPFNDSCISSKELAYLRRELPDVITKHSAQFEDNSGLNNNEINWKAFFTHRAVLVLYLAWFSYSWSGSIILMELPTYLNDELDFDLSKSGFVSFIPYLAKYAVETVGSVLIDKIIELNILTRANARKAAQTVGTIIPCILLIICGYLTNSTYVVILLSTAVGLQGFVICGCVANYGDISPMFSNIAYAIGNIPGGITNIITPILTGWMLEGENKECEWKFIFYIAFFVSCIGIIPLWVWGTAEKIDVLNRKGIVKN